MGVGFRNLKALGTIGPPLAGVRPVKLQAGFLRQIFPNLLPFPSQIRAGMVGIDQKQISRQAKLFTGFGEVPTGFSQGSGLNVLHLLAAAIADKHEGIGIEQKPPKHYSAIGWTPVRMNRRQLKIAAVRFAAITV
jgi:hypothetical protein